MRLKLRGVSILSIHNDIEYIPQYHIVLTYQYQMATLLKMGNSASSQSFHQSLWFKYPTTSHERRTEFQLLAGDFPPVKWRLVPCKLATVVATVSLNNRRNSQRHTHTPLGVSDLGYTESASIPITAPSQSSWRTGLHYSSWTAEFQVKGWHRQGSQKNCKPVDLSEIQSSVTAWCVFHLSADSHDDATRHLSVSPTTNKILFLHSNWFVYSFCEWHIAAM